MIHTTVLILYTHINTLLYHVLWFLAEPGSSPLVFGSSYSIILLIHLPSENEMFKHHEIPFLRCHTGQSPRHRAVVTGWVYFPFTAQLCCCPALHLLYIFIRNATLHPLVIHGINELRHPGLFKEYNLVFANILNGFAVWGPKAEIPCKSNHSWQAGQGRAGGRALPFWHQPTSRSLLGSAWGLNLLPNDLSKFPFSVWFSRKLNLSTTNAKIMI